MISPLARTLLGLSCAVWISAVAAQENTETNTPPQETVETGAPPPQDVPTEAAPQPLAAAPEIATIPVPELVPAREPAPSFLSNINVTVAGFLRLEAATSTDGQGNPNNQAGNPFNGKTIQRTTGNAAGFPGAPPYSQDSTSNLNGGRPLAALGRESAYNFHILRGEVETDISLSASLNFVSRVRAIYDVGYNGFDAASVAKLQGGGIIGGDPDVYGGKPNLFKYSVEGNGRPNPLEWTGERYQVYLPSLFLEYNNGPFNLRVGQQQIAWGQAIFFRVFDIPNGLDLRRHLVLDNAFEEFSDKRVPALGLRFGYQFNEEILLDAYVQKFQPTVLPNANTPYNVIPAQFTVHDLYTGSGPIVGRYDLRPNGYQNEYSYGLRIKGNYGQWGFQAAAVRRWNPDGVFRWTESKVNRGFSNTYDDGSRNDLGTAENTANGGPDGTGALLALVPFSREPGGVYSADEYFFYGANVRLDGVAGLNAAVDEYQPQTGTLFAAHVNNMADAHRELDTFFTAAGHSLRGHIAREYFQENVFALGASYVTEGEPGGVFDQLIINLETSYSPQRVFTNTSLSHNYTRQPEWISALVMEKYYRFSNSFPATYFVFQAMHRESSDLIGRDLKGYGATPTSGPTGVGQANYLVLAALQPFPLAIWKATFATLYDPAGGILVQPGLTYKPSGDWTIDAFYTYLNGKLGGNPNKNLISSLDFADEFTLRVGYQF